MSSNVMLKTHTFLDFFLNHKMYAVPFILSQVSENMYNTAQRDNLYRLGCTVLSF